jgi:hypothetical protein
VSCNTLESFVDWDPGFHQQSQFPSHRPYLFQLNATSRLPAPPGTYVPRQLQLQHSVALRLQFAQSLIFTVGIYPICDSFTS